MRQKRCWGTITTYFAFVVPTPIRLGSLWLLTGDWEKRGFEFGIRDSEFVIEGVAGEIKTPQQLLRLTCMPDGVEVGTGSRQSLYDDRRYFTLMVLVKRVAGSGLSRACYFHRCRRGARQCPRHRNKKHEPTIM